MTPPRATDARIAELLGWTDVVPDAYTPNGRDACGTPPAGVVPMWSTGRSVVPHYSTDISAAMSLVEHLITNGWSFSLDCNEPGRWEAKFINNNFYVPGEGNTAAAAIAAAARAAAEGGQR